jgi:hypothetical protein
MIGFPWTLLQWILPSIPEIISTVRSMKQEQQAHLQQPPHNDLVARIERLERAFKLQSQIDEEVAGQLQQLQKRLQFFTFLAILGLTLVVVALALIAFI